MGGGKHAKKCFKEMGRGDNEKDKGKGWGGGSGKVKATVEKVFN